MVPLALIFAQQPPIAVVRPILVDLANSDRQHEVYDALLQLEDDRYKDQILKLFTMLLEKESKEVDPDLWEMLFELKTPANLARLLSLANEPSIVRYDLPNDLNVKISEQRSTLVTAGQTGHRTWESSLALTEFICAHHAEFEGINEAIELGAGTGLVSLALAKLGLAQSILATDGSELVVTRLVETVATNQLKSQIATRVVDWSNPEDVASLPKNAVVFAGDILYGLTSGYPDILDALRVMRPSRVLFCNPIRNPAAYQEFKYLCEERNIGVKVLKTYEAESASESDYMFIVSLPPIKLELIELDLSKTLG